MTTMTLRSLTDHDRCDRCGAKAQVLVGTPAGGELTFCGHHATEHRAKLNELGCNFTSSRQETE